MLAALTLALGLPEAATSAPAGDQGAAVVATDQVALPATKAVTPRGHAESKDTRKPKGPLRTSTGEQLAAAQRFSRQKRPEVGSPRSARLAPPAGQLSFEGLNQGTTGLRPPDTHGAAGLSYYTEVTNGAGIGVFRKSDGVKVLGVSFASFFNYTTSTIFDPRVVYDRKWNRWVIVAEAFPEPSNPSVQNVFVAVSQSSDPTGGWFRYRLDLPEGTDFFDYPQVGLDQDAVIITGNVFNAAGTAYLRTRAFGLAKADIYNGRATGFPYFNLGAPGTVAPPIVEDNNSNAFLASASLATPTAVKLWRASGLGRSGASIAAPVNVAVPGFAAPPNARQPGSADRLDSLDARFQNASTQIGNQLLNIHTIATGSFPTPKWYQINTSTNAVTSSGLVLESGDSDDFNPSVVGSSVGGTSTNPIGRMFFTWSATDAVGSNLHQAAVKGSGRLATDPTNTTGGVTLAQASVAYNPSSSTVERWGDYSAVTIDPVAVTGCSAGQRAWLVNERQTSSTLWGSRFGRLGFC
ncbi:hypothetical protein ACFYO2_04870 [Streptomyces sp. NPDC006602]|uniref:hypothetical protein n=1 Tax=Streptomyces sp. NPDC006602 TaxID=3364751 RepID=UPI0036A365F2